MFFFVMFCLGVNMKSGRSLHLWGGYWDTKVWIIFLCDKHFNKDKEKSIFSKTSCPFFPILVCPSPGCHHVFGSRPLGLAFQASCHLPSAWLITGLYPLRSLTVCKRCKWQAQRYRMMLSFSISYSVIQYQSPYWWCGMKTVSCEWCPGYRL